ncbi:acyl-[acyl-carrier-protein]--UDP-N-acetylglucosamine O-acyltransferase [Paenibacillus uliginis N3/975]|uniref:Acyl-[acyl-carrier-protein]--UDP-N-acetylglucosamine O-acyltransferase n=1 Tax=Paenibacillus uliginis N3/975 TaxID=1313296 RepID=A0A1X7HHV5_9BACL|nr:acyl-[acyl-carrier-protein]--UDP-N-acetylglucosamine O-acyltransferase [Paenibacillus uliginis N3/975]
MIHPNAVLHESVVLGIGVEIGPFSVIDENVVIGDFCKIESHVRIHSHTTLGKHNHIYHSAAIGTDPQHITPDKVPTYLTIGDHNIIREYVTLSRGSLKGGSYTTIGDHNLIMSYAHIGHDCLVGNHTIISSGVLVAGHVEIEDYVVIGGAAVIQQFSKIGRNAMVGGSSGVNQDVVPFSLVSGTPIRYGGLNVVGLRRAGLSSEKLKEIKTIHSILLRKGLSLETATKSIEEMPPSEYVMNTLNFLNKSTRPLCRRAK